MDFPNQFALLRATVSVGVHRQPLEGNDNRTERWLTSYSKLSFKICVSYKVGWRLNPNPKTMNQNLSLALKNNLIIIFLLIESSELQIFIQLKICSNYFDIFKKLNSNEFSLININKYYCQQLFAPLTYSLGKTKV